MDEFRTRPSSWAIWRNVPWLIPLVKLVMDREEETDEMIHKNRLDCPMTREQSNVEVDKATISVSGAHG
jgi:hypothetical protein